MAVFYPLYIHIYNDTYHRMIEAVQQVRTYDMPTVYFIAIELQLQLTVGKVIQAKSYCQLLST